MNQKNRIKVVAINAFLMAALFGLVTLNKEILRPMSAGSNFLHVLTGCFPNFIAAYLISLAPAAAIFIRKPKHGRLIIYVSSIAVCILLIIEELKPMWGASTYYDPFDIMASGLGALLAIVTFEIILSTRRTELDQR